MVGAVPADRDAIDTVWTTALPPAVLPPLLNSSFFCDTLQVGPRPHPGIKLIPERMTPWVACTLIISNRPWVVVSPKSIIVRTSLPLSLFNLVRDLLITLADLINRNPAARTS